MPKSSMARELPAKEQDDCDDTESQKSTIGVNDKCEEPSDEDEESSSEGEPETGSGSQGEPSAGEVRQMMEQRRKENVNEAAEKYNGIIPTYSRPSQVAEPPEKKSKKKNMSWDWFEVTKNAHFHVVVPFARSRCM